MPFPKYEDILPTGPTPTVETPPAEEDGWLKQIVDLFNVPLTTRIGGNLKKAIDIGAQPEQADVTATRFRGPATKGNPKGMAEGGTIDPLAKAQAFGLGVLEGVSKPSVIIDAITTGIPGVSQVKTGLRVAKNAPEYIAAVKAANEYGWKAPSIASNIASGIEGAATAADSAVGDRSTGEGIFGGLQALGGAAGAYFGFRGLRAAKAPGTPDLPKAPLANISDEAAAAIEKKYPLPEAHPDKQYGMTPKIREAVEQELGMPDDPTVKVAKTGPMSLEDQIAETQRLQDDLRDNIPVGTTHDKFTKAQASAIEENMAFDAVQEAKKNLPEGSTLTPPSVTQSATSKQGGVTESVRQKYEVPDAEGAGGGGGTSGGGAPSGGGSKKKGPDPTFYQRLLAAGEKVVFEGPGAREEAIAAAQRLGTNVGDQGNGKFRLIPVGATPPAKTGGVNWKEEGGTPPAPSAPATPTGPVPGPPPTSPTAPSGAAASTPISTTEVIERLKAANEGGQPPDIAKPRPEAPMPEGTALDPTRIEAAKKLDTPETPVTDPTQALADRLPKAPDNLGPKEQIEFNINYFENLAKQDPKNKKSWLEKVAQYKKELKEKFPETDPTNIETDPRKLKVPQMKSPEELLAEAAEFEERAKTSKYAQDWLAKAAEWRKAAGQTAPPKAKGLRLSKSKKAQAPATVVEEAAVASEAPQTKVSEPVAPVKPTTKKVPAQAPVAAASKVVDELKRVVDTSGTKNAKEVHARVLSTLENELVSAEKASGFKEITVVPRGSKGDAAILADGELVATVEGSHINWRLEQSAPASPEDLEQLKRLTKITPGLENFPVSAKTPGAKRDAARNIVAKLLGEERGAKSITVEIPGDGSFTIPNNPHSIRQVIEKIRKGGASAWSDVTSPSTPTTPKSTGVRLSGRPKMNTEGMFDPLPSKTPDAPAPVQEPEVPKVDVPTETPNTKWTPDQEAELQAAAAKYRDIKGQRQASNDPKGSDLWKQERAAGAAAQKLNNAKKAAQAEPIPEQVIDSVPDEVTPAIDPTAAQDISDLESLPPEIRKAAIEAMIKGETDVLPSKGLKLGRGKRGGKEAGEYTPEMATRATTSAGGALAGSFMADDPNQIDPVTGQPVDPGMSPLAGAAIGAVAGFVSPDVARQAIRAARASGDAVAMTETGQKIKDTVVKYISVLPDIVRANLLANFPNLPINVWVGPYGSAVMGAIEHAASGDVRGWKALGKLWRIDEFGKQFVYGLSEAEQQIEAAHMRSEISDSLDVLNPIAKKAISLPGKLMTAGDIAARNILTKAGFSVDEARSMTLTDEPNTAFARGIRGLIRRAETPGGKKSVAMRVMLPFHKTALNQFEGTLERTPLVGFLTNLTKDKELATPMNAQLAQQVMGTGVMYGMYQAGYNTPADPVQTPILMKLISNAGGQYGMLAAAAFAAGQASAKGDPMGLEDFGRTLLQNMPLPTTRPLQEAGAVADKALGMMTGETVAGEELNLPMMGEEGTNLPTMMWPQALRPNEVEEKSKALWDLIAGQDQPEQDEILYFY